MKMWTFQLRRLRFRIEYSFFRELDNAQPKCHLYTKRTQSHPSPARNAQILPELSKSCPKCPNPNPETYSFSSSVVTKSSTPGSSISSSSSLLLLLSENSMAELPSLP